MTSALVESWLKFRDIAQKEGYTVKVVGAYAFRTPRRRNGAFHYIRLSGVRNGKLIIERWSA